MGNIERKREMKYKKITAKQAYRIMDRLGLDYGDDGRTYYITNEAEEWVAEFDSLKEREEYLKQYNS